MQSTRDSCILLVFFCSILICEAGVPVSSTCIPSGSCLPCTQEELNREYCFLTSYREEVMCSSSGKSNETATFRSCSPSHQIETLKSFYLFEMSMFGLLVAACYVVVWRKRRLAQIQHEKIAKQIAPSSTVSTFQSTPSQPKTTKPRNIYLFNESNEQLPNPPKESLLTSTATQTDSGTDVVIAMEPLDKDQKSGVQTG